jgi:CheY-like chemotaxis protein
MTQTTGNEPPATAGETTLASAASSHSSDELSRHPLAGLLLSMARRLDAMRAEITDPAGLAVLQQEALWFAQYLDDLDAARRLDPDAQTSRLVSLDLRQIAKERVDAIAGPAALRKVTLKLEAQIVREALGEPLLVDRVLGALLYMAVLACEPGSGLSVNVSEEDGSVDFTIRPLPGSEVGAGAQDALTTAWSLPSDQLGAGLDGLQPLVDAQGGTLEARDLGPDGFELLFRLAEAKQTDSMDEGTVLIVDDDPDGAFLLEQVLVKAGFHVRIAGNGLEGLALARQSEVAVILLDVMLPGLDGFEVCHRLREDPATASTPIVMISAKSRPEDRAMGLKVGASEYMTKPLGMNEVVETVTRYMEMGKEGTHDR